MKNFNLDLKAKGMKTTGWNSKQLLLGQMGCFVVGSERIDAYRKLQKEINGDNL